MGNSYTRQSAADIVDGQIVTAAPLNSEFNALQNVFHSTLGHTHNGNLGEGPKIGLTTSIVGVLPVVNGGYGAIHNVTATTAPGASNDSSQGYGVGSVWVNTVTKQTYKCVDATPTAAIWFTSQPLDAGLSSIAGLTTAADKMIYTTAMDVYATTALTPFARSFLDDVDGPTMLTTLGISTYIKTLLDDVDAPTARTTLGLGSIATQNSNAVSITGGSLTGVSITSSTLSGSATITGGTVTGITDLAIADGGTGASDATTARANLGLDQVNNTSDANKPVSTAQATSIAAAITTAAPPGQICHFANSTVPTGWLKANGAAVSRTTYAALFAYIGTGYGAGDGSTTFNVPDYRGYFIRSWDDGRGIDSGRTMTNTAQASTFTSHGHSISDPGHNHGHSDPGHNHGVNDPGHAHNPSWGGGFVTTGAGVGNIGSTVGGSGLQSPTSTDARGTGIYLSASGTGLSNSASGTGISIVANGGSETRPVNYPAMVCIKY